MKINVPERRPRILIWDIETTPMVVTAWQLFKPMLGHDNIRQESTLICGAWKWLDTPGVESVEVSSKSPMNDRRVVRTLHKVLSSADMVVGHNGDKFDLRKFNARAVWYGLAPLPDIPTIDTLKVARKVFGFNSNRLDYLGRFLCGQGKIKTEYDLWLQIMAGDAAALAKMVTYNKGDVHLLERVYRRLRPYMRHHPNSALYNDTPGCRVCSSTNFTRRGFKYQAETKRQQYQCNDCGAWFCGKYEKRA